MSLRCKIYARRRAQAQDDARRNDIIDIVRRENDYIKTDTSPIKTDIFPPSQQADVKKPALNVAGICRESKASKNTDGAEFFCRGQHGRMCRQVL